MTNGSKPVNVTILDKEYLISCKDNEREQLHSAVSYLNHKLQELKNSGKVIGTERIAVMTALNIANEFLAYRQENNDYTHIVDATIKRIQGKINSALDKDRNLEDFIQD